MNKTPEIECRASAELVVSVPLDRKRFFDAIISVCPPDEIHLQMQMETGSSGTPREVASLVFESLDEAQRAAGAIAKAFESLRDLRRFMQYNSTPDQLANVAPAEDDDDPAALASSTGPAR